MPWIVILLSGFRLRVLHCRLGFLSAISRLLNLRLVVFLFVVRVLVLLFLFRFAFFYTSSFVFILKIKEINGYYFTK